ncbi:MAG TPA: ferritin-like domain-containing protein [Candidatus Eremiobacteraceae bacterium]|jgi:ferritin-like metal-binding protein YciE|nr:ferritin-like domain-containing protein [Candidatus Eremiobacteraceae bacterium]
MSELATIKDLLEEEIKDLYSAEKQLTKAIPKMAKGSNNEELASAFEAHLKETVNQVNRLERVAELLGTEPGGKKCKGMEGVIEEGSEALDENGDENVIDLGIIGAGSRVEHYEMAGYMTAISLAKQLGENEAVTLLNESLQEEQAAENKLRTIAQTVVKSAPTAELGEKDAKEKSKSAKA